ncbi:hypothetical protein PoB_001407800 [Plakobranchus ocellatus]|uniref:Uncharacterized protein n=1 Tax=Plakobranchus ocellatus TaxID=259542 RepID=A0AAV3YYI0_9GAST|nr:hypothetical protein PoB_001407800 [Plakobranchus ocellatus]
MCHLRYETKSYIPSAAKTVPRPTTRTTQEARKKISEDDTVSTVDTKDCLVLETLGKDFVEEVWRSWICRDDTSGVGSTVASESALRSAWTLLSRVRALPPAPWPDGRPTSLRSPCELIIYKKQSDTRQRRPYTHYRTAARAREHVAQRPPTTMNLFLDALARCKIASINDDGNTLVETGRLFLKSRP